MFESTVNYYARFDTYIYHCYRETHLNVGQTNDLKEQMDRLKPAGSRCDTNVGNQRISSKYMYFGNLALGMGLNRGLICFSAVCYLDSE